MTKKQREEQKRLARIARAQARFEEKQGAVAVATEEPANAATTALDTAEASKPLESQGMAVSGHSGGIVALEVPAASVGIPMDLSRKARVYGCPLNPRMRLIEFDDGTHGQLWVKLDAQRMLNWRIWVKPDVNRPNPPGAHWVMDGSYNWRGIRIK